MAQKHYIILFYLLTINLIKLVLYGLDKKRVVKNEHRIRESEYQDDLLIFQQVFLFLDWESPFYPLFWVIAATNSSLILFPSWRQTSWLHRWAISMREAWPSMPCIMA